MINPLDNRIRDVLAQQITKIGKPYGKNNNSIHKAIKPFR